MKYICDVKLSLHNADDFQENLHQEILNFKQVRNPSNSEIENRKKIILKVEFFQQKGQIKNR